MMEARAQPTVPVLLSSLDLSNALKWQSRNDLGSSHEYQAWRDYSQLTRAKAQGPQGYSSGRHWSPDQYFHASRSRDEERLRLSAAEDTEKNIKKRHFFMPPDFIATLLLFFSPSL